MKLLKKLTLSAFALPIAAIPVITTSCNKQETTTFEIDSKGLVTLKDKSLTTVTIPATINDIEVHGIATNGFKETKVESVSFEKPNQITRIEDYAFAGCASLKSFIVPKNVTYLGIGAFSGCCSLETFNFEHGIKIQTLREKTFENVNKLYRFDVPGSVITMEKNLFAYTGTSDLTKLNFSTKKGWKQGSTEIPESEMEPDNCSKNFKNFKESGPYNWGYTGIKRTPKEADVLYNDPTLSKFIFQNKKQHITEEETIITFDIKATAEAYNGEYVVWANNASGYLLNETIYNIDNNNWVTCSLVIDNWTYITSGDSLTIKAMKK